jgi:hypothetical protein
LAESWTSAQKVLPPDRWLAIRSEYGGSAWWVAVALAPEDVDDFEVVGSDGEGPEVVLDRLAGAVARQALPPSVVPGTTTPKHAAGSSVLADALKTVEGALPRGWWLQGIEGCEALGSPAGWLAFANGGPDNDFAGEQGWGSTPEEALTDLAMALGRISGVG